LITKDHIAQKILKRLLKFFYAMIENAIADLHRRGFTSSFTLLGKRLFCAQTQSFFNGNQFDIVEVHSFEEDYPDSGQTIVYAIECISNAIKGILFQSPDVRNSQEILSKKLQKFWK
jgi:hypothetical protein